MDKKEKTLEKQLKDIDNKHGNGEYHDILWYAVQSLKDNAMQTTWSESDSIEACGTGENCSGGCAGCTLKCAKAGKRSLSDSEIPGSDPFAERNVVSKDDPPLPETTFPFIQIAISLAACVAGCFLAQNLIMNLLGK